VLVMSNENPEPPQSYEHYVVPEIAKREMIATASSIYNPTTPASNAIDGIIDGSHEWLAANLGLPQWLRLNLGAQYLVSKFEVQPTDWPEDYLGVFEVYVTDSTSSSYLDWGTPVVTKDAQLSTALQVLTFRPAQGQYVILRVVTGKRLARIWEVWTYGIKVGAAVSEFEIADQTSGNTQITNDRTIDVTAFVRVPMLGQQLTGWLIDETGIEPDSVDPRWQTSQPATYTIEGDDNTDITVYGWVRDSLNNVGGWHASILLNLAMPTVSDLLVAADTPTSARAYFTTDSETFACVKFAEHGTENWQVSVIESTHSTSHAVRFTGLTPETIYDVIVANNEKDEPAVVCNHLPGYSGYQELSKLPMLATASSTWGGFPPQTAINDVIEVDGGWLSEGVAPPQWLRIDLGDSYLV